MSSAINDGGNRQFSSSEDTTTSASFIHIINSETSVLKSLPVIISIIFSSHS